MHVFDSAYIISDLHLGGVYPSQMFNRGKDLASAIDQITKSVLNTRVALVVNGDMVDFLAEPRAIYFDGSSSFEKIDRIASDDSFSMVFLAIRNFLAVKHSRLFVNLGNHDLELALPPVKRHFIDVLSDNKSSLKPKIEIVTDGSGVRFQIGGRSVLCLHGNEVDIMNCTDFEKLRRISCDWTAKKICNWVPNAGAMIVVDIVNRFKKKYPFIDVLKPDSTASIPILLMMEPQLITELTTIRKLAFKRSKDGLRKSFGLLSKPTAETLLSQQLRNSSKRSGTSVRGYSSMDELQVLIDNGGGINDFIDDDDSLLGFWNAFYETFVRADGVSAIREVLKAFISDDAFSVDTADRMFQQMDKLVSTRVDFLVTGHTHLRRAIQRSSGGVYFNTGTWARFLPMKSAFLDSIDFEDNLRQLVASDVSKLDALGTFYPTLAHIETVKNNTQGQLMTLDGNKQLIPIPDTLLFPSG